ncbi:hypothetical protein AB0284_01230 [Pseudarthrobacter phenanthrenivorans]|jgi:hypothetical protein|uniref:Fis family transcriptional regulator n=1 Tax=Pseudarthrobacter phenanthrenivorans TaxID=361575 RepID=A0A0B4ENY4_PSEPS|nr:hypothetical protein [Pseudarthrobacter phenanthrenivorans]KIC68423.1 hypothetical protein RM50_05375 [Pseudarthrobacter phenanthrenivorans]
MRWDALFNDMESQLAEADRLALETEVNDRARAEMVGLPLEDRLRATIGCRIGVHLLCGDSIQGELLHAGADALVLDAGRHQVLIPYWAAARYTGLGRHMRAENSRVRRSLGFAHSLRSLARDRSELVVTIGGGAGMTRLAGVIDRVGSDYLDLAAVVPGEARRSGSVGQVSAIPFSVVAMVRSNNSGAPQAG